jgi:hypothetical protein
MSERNRLLRAALAYAGLGWAVHPLRPRDKRPLLRDWPHKATTDGRVIQEWWARWPEANIGVACGPSGLFVIDLDVKGDVHGEESWTRLKEQHGLGDLVTPATRTPSGGQHLFFSADGTGLGNTAGRLGAGIDTRGEGGYVLLPPSVLAGGKPYTWEISPREHNPAPLPQALIALLADPEPGQRGDVGGLRLDGTYRGTAYAMAALSGELEKLATASRGTRNNTLNMAAYSLGQLVGAGLLNRAEVESQLLSQALSTGLDEREAQATVASGLRAGEKQPRPVPDNGHGPIAILPSAREVHPILVDDDRNVPPLPAYARLPEGLGRDACRWLDDYVRFSQTWSPRSFDGFHEACGLWLLSTVAARRVLVHYGRPRYTNLYFLLAGRTTMHAKSSATDIARQLLRACELDYLLAADEATPQAFVRALAGGGLPLNFDRMEEAQRLAAQMRLGFCGQRGWYAEEFGSWLASMTRTDGVMADFRGLLRKLDDCPLDYSRSTIARGDEVIRRPYLALIANLTPADLRPVAKKGTQLWGDGFLARFAFVTPPRDEVLTTQFPKGQRPYPPELTAPLVEWHQRLGLPKVEVESQIDRDGNLTGEKIVTIEPAEPQVCTLADDVWDALHRYNTGVLEIAQGGELTDLDGNYGRLHEKALRVATLLASLENGGRIELQHWARAQRVAERWRLYAHRLYEQVTEPAASPQAEIEDKVLDAIRRWQGTEKYPEGLTANEIGRFLRGLGSGEAKHYADQLVEAGVLANQKRGRAIRYYLPDPEANRRQ